MAKTSMKIRQARPAKFSTRAYTRCRLCGRPHSVLRRYGICRICFRELAYKGQIKVTLKYVNGKSTPVIAGLKRISKPGLRVYARCEELPKVLGGLGVAIISTSKGLMTDRAARKENLGGEVLCYIW